MQCLCMGETLLRYATGKGKRLEDLSFHVHVGGSETNIAISLANFGYNSQLFTKISDNELGKGIMQFLHRYQVDTTKVLRSSKRVGSYFLEQGSGNRTSKVIYDRADAAMTSLSREEIDIAQLFREIDIFIVSGITVALSEELEILVITMMKYCQEHKIKVVYDVNYRAKLWTQEEAGASLIKILPYVDILSAGHLDAKYLLKIETNQQTFTDTLVADYQTICSRFPNIKYIVSTKRDVISTSVNQLQGFLYDGHKLISSSVHKIDDIVDRVGAGDAFIAGIIHGLLQQKDLPYIIDFACCASVLKHTIYGDANVFGISEIEEFMHHGTARIQR